MEDWITTSTILARLRGEGDDDIWEHFCRRFHRPIVGFARSLGLNESDAADAAQETLVSFLSALRRGGYDPQKGRLNKWLFGIAYRKTLAARRKRPLATPNDTASDLLASIPDESVAEQAWDEEWERAVVETCLGRVRAEVNDKTYAAFELVVRQGVSADAAADRLGMSRAAIYTAKHRVLRRARELAATFDD